MVTEVPCNEGSWVYEGFFGGKRKIFIISSLSEESEINSTGKTGIRKKITAILTFSSK